MFSQPRQDNNTAGGHIAGRDVVTNNFGGGKATQIERLYQLLKADAENGASAPEFIEQLQHFMGVIPTKASRTLADKLSSTGRADLTVMAVVAKERAAKKIMRFETSAAAQEIFAYVLGELHTKYLSHIRPLIAAGANRIQIDSAMEERVIRPVTDAMEPSTLGVTPDMVIAMLFYLAGNCHVEWD